MAKEVQTVATGISAAAGAFSIIVIAIFGGVIFGTVGGTVSGWIVGLFYTRAICLSVNGLTSSK